MKQKYCKHCKKLTNVVTEEFLDTEEGFATGESCEECGNYYYE